MSLIEQLNLSVDYIETHLTEEIDFKEIAKIALCSSYHFQRMFSYMTDMTITEYIRRRKMSRAAIDLLAGEKVIDVALKYGYDSPTAFNRAFQSVHAVSPSGLKKNNSTVISFTPIRFAISMKGANEMNFKLVSKDAFKVVGVSKKITCDISKNYPIISDMWNKVSADGTIDKLCGYITAQPAAVLGLSICNDPTDWQYAIGVESNRDASGSEFQEFVVPAATWAVFIGEGSHQAINDFANRIYTEWFPSSGYVFDNAPSLEVYYSPDPDHAKYEFWLPVVPKA